MLSLRVYFGLLDCLTDFCTRGPRVSLPCQCAGHVYTRARGMARSILATCTASANKPECPTDLGLGVAGIGTWSTRVLAGALNLIC